MPIYINEKLLETFKFPGGECHLNINKFDFTVPVTVTAYLYTSDDIMCLLLLDSAIEEIMYRYPKIHKLIIPYFPYARQDRVCNPGEPFSLRVMARIIKYELNVFSSVEVLDPHSDITKNWLKNTIQIRCQTEIISNTILPSLVYLHNLTLIAPDKGATDKVLSVVDMLLNQGYLNINYLIANKVRDSATGKIISTEIEGDITNKSCIIIDDICDGGATFIELAKVLKDKGAADLYLYVTHGIFSKGLDVLRPYFKHIYCYHTMLCELELDKNYLTILKKGV